MPHLPLIVVGASAGGIEALRILLATLPAPFPAALAVVIHRGPVQNDDRLVNVLAARSTIPIATANDGDAIVAGRAYVCPAAVHLIAKPEHFRLSAGPHENRVRPAIDVTLRSAAESFGPRAAGVLLSGTLDDGTAGLAAIKARGGYAMVQSPEEATFNDMPRNAIANVALDDVLTLADMASAFVRFIRRVEGSIAPAQTPQPASAPSLFSCPDCGGVLSQIDGDGVVRFRCRTGHAYSPMTLYASQYAGIEGALWVALRALVERADLSDRLARRSRASGLHAAAQRFERETECARENARLLRSVLEEPTAALDAAFAADELQR